MDTVDMSRPRLVRATLSGNSRAARLSTRIEQLLQFSRSIMQAAEVFIIV